ncbi:hypothetical protein FD755_005803 [Muntiacus reevesi]|uniref:Uncharacterized protein n=1 Tax=Muntiacus reevesi TaxID=9886 RepID=A0A5J5MWH3_MUNRE|nr:hypothetical protein FD755_005803 [Muntiacus reevesi]
MEALVETGDSQSTTLSPLFPFSAAEAKGSSECRALPDCTVRILSERIPETINKNSIEFFLRSFYGLTYFFFTYRANLGSCHIAHRGGPGGRGYMYTHTTNVYFSWFWSLRSPRSKGSQILWHLILDIQLQYQMLTMMGNLYSVLALMRICLLNKHPGIRSGLQKFRLNNLIKTTNMTQAEKVAFSENLTINIISSSFNSYFLTAFYSEDITEMDDILIGAPLFMEREFESSPREVGQVYLYLQESALVFRDPQVLAGTEVFGRFGSAVAHLGDLNQDGYNDIAVGAPFAGRDQRGKVLVYNGNKNGLHTKPSQILQGAWASQAVPSGFGFTLRGDSDIDKNDYPGNFSLKVCASVAGQNIANTIGLTAEVQLDTLKQKGAIKRTLFLDNHQSHLVFPLVIKGQKSPQCQDFIVYLRDETEFRDKLSPINISVNYSLDESTFQEGLEVKPILNYYRDNVVTEQAHILVDCGEDNMCIPDLKLSARPDKPQVIIGDENHLMLIINARNEGEGAYEAELFVLIPEEADYVGIERSNKALRPLSCEYKMDNVTRMVVCDLGNPMVAGTNFSLGLRFTVPRLEKTNMSINFDLQIRSSNKDNPDSNFVSLQINITAVAQVEIRGVSHPPQIVLPIQNWEPEEEPRKEEGVGPLVEHIYELHNIGPSTISDTLLEVGWPFSARDEFLLYIFHIQTLGPLRCQTNPDINPQDIKNCTNIECLQISCAVGRLGGGESAVLKVRSRLWAKTFLQRKNDPYSLASLVSFEVKKMPYKDQPAKLPEGHIAIKTSVIWATPNVSFSIPLWVIILAILLGLLVLAILTLALWKCGFFDRARPPQDDMNDREQLTNEKTPEA